MVLASRWAEEETLVKKAIQQDARAQQKSESPKKPAVLPSKWADAEDAPEVKEKLGRRPQSEARVSHLTEKLAGPGSGKRGGIAREKDRREHKDQKDKDHEDKDHKDNHHKDNHHKDNRGRKDKDHKGNKDARDSRDRDRDSRDSHKELHGSRRDGPKNKARAHTGDILHEKGPVTDAARSLAARIGQPGKYLTPGQKRDAKLREEREKDAEKTRQAQAEKDARLQQEVRDMFEKMSDKSTNWADIEDDY